MFIVGSGEYQNIVVNSEQVLLFRNDYYLHQIIAELSNDTSMCLGEYPNTLAQDVAFSALLDTLYDNAVMLYRMTTVEEIWEMIKDAQNKD